MTFFLRYLRYAFYAKGKVKIPTSETVFILTLLSLLRKKLILTLYNLYVVYLSLSLSVCLSVSLSLSLSLSLYKIPENLVPNI